MARFQNKSTGVVVSVAASKAHRFAQEWKALGDDEAPSSAKRGRKTSAPAAPGSKPTTVKGIIADVGDDPAKAAEALAAEQTADQPRKSLVEALEAVIAASDQS